MTVSMFRMLIPIRSKCFSSSFFFYAGKFVYENIALNDLPSRIGQDAGNNAHPQRIDRIGIRALIGGDQKRSHGASSREETASCEESPEEDGQRKVQEQEEGLLSTRNALLHLSARKSSSEARKLFCEALA